ncbi:MAG: CBS domain-containing protein [Burkholderiaceae bacterium]|nr:CBS domain-containing protein [Burkholderiaceae bacterium]
MARNPYGNGHRGPDSPPRDRSRSSAWPGEYSGDLDDGRFQTHPMQRAGSGFTQSAPQPRGARYGSQQSRYGARSGRSSFESSGQRYSGELHDDAWQRDDETRYGEGRRYAMEYPAARGYGYGSTGMRTGVQGMRNRGPRNWQRSDERIREDVCERLASLDDVDVSDVSVSVEQGTVRLTGSVAQRGDKHRIEDVADDSVGVRDVDNQIRVRRDDARSSGGFWGQLFGFESGAKARDVMTREVITVSPSDTVRRAAQIMKDADIGSVPVCDGQRLQGMITDRDIAVRVVAAALPVDTTQATQAMTSEVFWCYEDDDIADVLDKMGDQQVRRIPVVDRDHKLTGIISLGDMAVQRSGDQVQDALEEISTPSPKGSTDMGTSAGATGSTRPSGSQERH